MAYCAARDGAVAVSVVGRLASVSIVMRRPLECGAYGCPIEEKKTCQIEDTLKLEAEKDNLVSIATTYARLDVQLLRGAEAATADAEAQRGVHEAVARVEAKKLQKVLAALLGTDIKVHNALLCIIPHTSVVLKFFLPDQNTGSSCLIFYLPACLL